MPLSRRALLERTAQKPILRDAFRLLDHTLVPQEHCLFSRLLEGGYLVLCLLPQEVFDEGGCPPG